MMLYLFACFLLTKFIYLIYIKVTVSPPFSPPKITSPPPPQSNPPPFLFKKKQVSHRYQQNVTNQVAIELSASSYLKAG